MLRCLFGALYVDMRCFGVSWVFSKHTIPHPNQWGSMITTKKYCLFNENFSVVCFICIQVQNVLPSSAHPFCWHADKMQDKGFQPACLFQWLDLIADMKDEIEIEVLQHGGNHHENHVLSHKGKGQMRPSEVIVLYIEVLFACSTLIVECNDVFLISDISKCFENFVSQTLGVLTRIYAAELRDKQKSEEPDEVPRFM